MSGFFVMLKANLKLVFRNKASIFLLLLIPLASVLILKVPDQRADLESGLNKMNVRILDNSSSFLSKELIDVLKSNGAFEVTVDEEKTKDLDSVREKALDIANRSTTNGIIYIPSDFSEAVIKGNTNNLINIFSTGSDDRVKLLESNINRILLRFDTYSEMAKGDKEVFQQLMKRAEQDKTNRESIALFSEQKALKPAEKYKVFNFGYLVAIMSITLMFSGNFVSSIFIEEKNNRVLKRISCTKCSMFNYGIVKAVVALAALIIQIAMIIVGIKLFVRVDVGISLMGIAALVLGLGLIFNSLSIALGAVFENLSTANYLAFFIVTISALMSGLYFPLDITPEWMQNASLLMPQRWVVKTAEQMILGYSDCLPLFGAIVIAYMILFAALGFLGLKFNKD